MRGVILLLVIAIVGRRVGVVIPVARVRVGTWVSGVCNGSCGCDIVEDWIGRGGISSG